MLYAEAVKNGYSVTDEEVSARLEELKKTISGADNKKLAEDVMRGFGSEEAYWEYEAEVVKKDLPIEKFKEGLREQYKNGTVTLRGEKIEVDAKEVFEDFFDNYTEKRIKEQNFTAVE